MAFDPTLGTWNKTGCTASSDGTLTEDDTINNRHSFYQDVQDRVDDGMGTSAILKAQVTPLGRDRCWIGARQNNNTYMASFLLTGSGSVTSQGSQVTSASISFDSETGRYLCRVNFVGTFSTSSTVFAVGAMINDNQEDYNGSPGLDAIKVEEPQLIPGSIDKPYVATTDRTNYFDISTSGGAHNALMPVSSKPTQVDAEFIVCNSTNGLSITDWSYSTEAFTVCAVVDWDGGTTTKPIASHGDGASDHSWLMYLTTDGKFAFGFTEDGENYAKLYTATRALVVDEKTLLTATWDGTDLKLYYNDIELVGPEITLTIDGSASGSIFDSTQDLAIGDLHEGKYYERMLYTGAASAAEVAVIAAECGLSGLPDDSDPGGGGGGDLPATTAAMITWLNDEGYTSGDIFYVNNSTGSDSNDGTSSGTAWATIQKAANTLTAGQAVLISGAGGRFYEQVTPQNSGTSGNRILFVGDPENPCILDASEPFVATWTSEGGNMWSAPYNKTRYYDDDNAYYIFTTTNPLPRSVWQTHQVIFEDKQLVRYSKDDHTVEPGSMNAGECWFKTTGDTDSAHKTPTEVWIRLPANENPNSEDIRIASDKRYLFDYHATTWVEGFPGANDNGSGNRTGRDYIGLINMHFKFGACIRKRGPIAIRGTGWWLKWSSVSDANSYSFTHYGDDHLIENCKFINSGCGPCRMEYSQFGGGTTTYSRCLFKNDNIHGFPESWDAGFKISYSGDAGLIKWSECHFYQSGAVGVWWDLFNGNTHPGSQAFLIDKCIFEEQGRHAIFVEHNSELVHITNTGIYKTQETTDGEANHTLGSGIRIAGAGLCTFSNNAVVRCDGKGWYSKAGQDGRGPNNFDTVTNNVFVNNAGSANIDVRLCEFFGGDDKDEPGTHPWSSSTIDGNVFYNGLGTTGFDYFVEANGASGWSDGNTISWFEDASRTNGSGNVIETSAANVVSDENDRKDFWVTVGSYTAKGPQGLTHYEDLSDTGWTIPS